MTPPKGTLRLSLGENLFSRARLRSNCGHAAAEAGRAERTKRRPGKREKRACARGTREGTNESGWEVARCGRQRFRSVHATGLPRVLTPFGLAMSPALEPFDLKNESLGNSEAHRERIDRLLGGANTELVPLLQAIQVAFGFLPRDVLQRLAQHTQIPLARIYGVATFYTGFFFAPRGRHIVRVCHGTACHVRGSPRITDELSRTLHVQSGETTEDREFTLERVACVGCCSLAPVVVVDHRTHGRLDAKSAVKLVAKAAQDGR